MKKITLSIALLIAPIIATANNFSMPGFNNGNGFSNGSNWNMPNMNWGNSNNGYNNGFNNGSNWSMPNMNWGNSANNYNGNNLGGSNWNMPNMNWGNSNNGNGYNNGSSWNMPNMNWGNSVNNNNGFPNGSNWTMPTMNWGNGNSNYAPNVQYRAPAMPVAPHFTPSAPRVTVQTQAPIAKKPVVKAAAPVVNTMTATKATVQNKIPMPSEVKGVILAPTNKTMKIEATK